jgi:protein SCO1/2
MLHKVKILDIFFGISIVFLSILFATRWHWVGKTHPYLPAGSLVSFELTLPNGSSIATKNWHGKWVLLYFGYGHCSKICPNSLLRLAKTLSILGPYSQKIQAFFITLDPKRDGFDQGALDRLQGYISSFNPNIIALSGTQDQTQEIVHLFKISTKSLIVDEANQFNHSGFIYAIDPNGILRHSFPYGLSPEQMALTVQRDFASILQE